MYKMVQEDTKFPLVKGNPWEIVAEFFDNLRLEIIGLVINTAETRRRSWVSKAAASCLACIFYI